MHRVIEELRVGGFEVDGPVKLKVEDFHLPYTS